MTARKSLLVIVNTLSRSLIIGDYTNNYLFSVSAFEASDSKVRLSSSQDGTSGW